MLFIELYFEESQHPRALVHVWRRPMNCMGTVPCERCSAQNIVYN